MTQEKGLVTQEQTKALEAKKKAFRGSLVRVEEGERQKAETLLELGFDPGWHLAVYHNTVMVTKVGMWWWAAQESRFGRVVSQPIAGKDLRDAYGLGPDEIGVIAYVYLKGDTVPFCSGFGRASKDASKPVARGSIVEPAHPYLLAEKRAEIQAMKKFRPIGVKVNVIDRETGEIIEGTAQEVPEPPPQPPADRRGRTAEPTTGIGTPPGWPVGTAAQNTLEEAIDQELGLTPAAQVIPQRRSTPAQAGPRLAPGQPHFEGVGQLAGQVSRLWPGHQQREMLEVLEVKTWGELPGRYKTADGVRDALAEKWGEPKE